MHRFENIFKKNKFTKLVKIITEASKKCKIIFILHPPTKKQLKKFKLYKQLENNKNIELHPRYNYSDFMKLLSRAQYIMTDGGSNQEESYYLGKPCLLLRKSTERNEGLNKNVILSQYNEDKIMNFINNYKNYKLEKIKSNISPSEIIIKELISS